MQTQCNWVKRLREIQSAQPVIIFKKNARRHIHSYILNGNLRRFKIGTWFACLIFCWEPWRKTFSTTFHKATVKLTKYLKRFCIYRIFTRHRINNPVTDDGHLTALPIPFPIIMVLLTEDQCSLAKCLSVNHFRCCIPNWYANNRVYYAPMVVCVCLHIPLPHYHHCANVSRSIWNSNMSF